MLKKILLLTGLIIIIIIECFAALKLNIKETGLNPIKITKSIQEKVSETKLKNKREKLTIAYGGQEKINELFKNSRLFCLDDTDCVVQEGWCCDSPTNRYNYKKYIPTDNSVCFALCPLKTAPTCENNECMLIETNY